MQYTTKRNDKVVKPQLFCNFAKRYVDVMVTEEDVQLFLSQFQEKLKIYGILYRDDRGKNQRALEILEIVPSFRRIIIENIKVEDYVKGPIVDELNKIGEMWVFGKDVKDH